jgi:hypothetical protein
MGLTFGELTLATVRQIVNLHELGVVPEHWKQMAPPLIHKPYKSRTNGWRFFCVRMCDFYRVCL